MSDADEGALKPFQTNPFWILGATPRDSRRRIVELADERILDSQGDSVRRARAALTNPRTRLKAEITWLPGVSPGRAMRLLDILSAEPESLLDESGVPGLARANLLGAAVVPLASSGAHRELIVRLVLSLSETWDALSPEDVLRDINVDRDVAGFPHVADLQQAADAIASRQRDTAEWIRGALDSLATATLVEVMVELVDNATAGGNRHPPKLVDDVVHQYELSAKGFLDAEAENVRRLIGATTDAAREGDPRLQAILQHLETVARNWDHVAQPVQLSYQAMGRDHTPSTVLAREVRGLAIDLVNEYGLLEESRRVIRLVEEVFAELPQVVEQTADDHEALDNLFRGRDQASEDWEREITFSADLGRLTTKVLSISPSGVSWMGRSFPLAEITLVRWGATRHSINGIPTGTSYTVAFGTSSSEAVAQFRDGTVFAEFVDRLYRAVGVRLLMEMPEHTQSG